MTFHSRQVRTRNTDSNSSVESSVVIYELVHNFPISLYLALHTQVDSVSFDDDVFVSFYDVWIARASPTTLGARAHTLQDVVVSHNKRE